jgi:hypothetical protein
MREHAVPCMVREEKCRSKENFEKYCCVEFSNSVR